MGRERQHVLVEALVEHVLLRGGGAAHVVPPVARERHLAEGGAVRAQERGLAAVEVAVVPHLRRDGRELEIRVRVRVRAHSGGAGGVGWGAKAVISILGFPVLRFFSVFGVFFADFFDFLFS